MPAKITRKFRRKLVRIKYGGREEGAERGREGGSRGGEGGI